MASRDEKFLFMTNNPSPMDGAALKAWRRSARLTQQQLATLLDIPVLTISGWETGRLAIKRPMMLRLALQALEVQLGVSGN